MPPSPLVRTIIVLATALLCCVESVRGDAEPPRGVSPDMAPRYERQGDVWTCLDGSRSISYSAINDDYCDCPDSSDEPGTSACPEGRFFCKNEGHLPKFIPSSRVNDGICDPDCCDGSDEYDGRVQCPNECERIGADYRERVRKLEDLRKRGAIKRREYIEAGKRKQKEREADLERLKIELEAVKLRVAERKVALAKAEKAEKRAKDSTLEACRERVKKLKGQVERLEDQVEQFRLHIDTLKGILKTLKDDHNPNYHDMAVKTAISGYDEFMRDHDHKIEGGSKNDKDGADDEEDDEEDEMRRADDGEEETTSYIEWLYMMTRTTVEGVLNQFGLEQYVVWNKTGKKAASRAVKNARSALSTSEKELRDVERRLKDIEGKLGTDFGQELEFAQLDDECFEHDTGEYTYILCMFGTAKQKSNKDKTSTTLGTFSKWTGAESRDKPDYYSAQLYDNGQHCWNGPNRSVKLFLECAAENQILSVSEPERCEYHMRMTTPALCRDTSTIKEVKHKVKYEVKYEEVKYEEVKHDEVKHEEL